MLVLVALSGVLPAASVSPAPPAAMPHADSPPWAVGCWWRWSGDQDIYLCATVGGSTLKLTRVTGDLEDTLSALVASNGTPCYLVGGNCSMTVIGTLYVMGLPVPVSWPLTGNTSECLRVPDLATVHEEGHFTIDMGVLGTASYDFSTDANPPLEYYRFPLDLLHSWRCSSSLSVRQRTSGALGDYEAAGNDSTDFNASVPNEENVRVGAGTFACFNITYTGTYTSDGGTPRLTNSSALYSPLVTNVVVRTFEPIPGLFVSLGLSAYSLNHAPVAASPPPDVSFPEDSTGSLDLGTAFSDPDPGDVLGFSASNFTNISVEVDNSSATATFSPPKNWCGSERMIFTATDEKGASASAEIQVNVTPVNHPPFLMTPFRDMVIDEDTADGSVDLSVHFGDVDITYGDSLNYSFRDNGSIAVGISAAGIVTLRPFENWSGLEGITFIATDTQGAWAGGTLRVSVLNKPDAPVVTATAHEFTLPEDTSLAVDLSARFYDADIPYGDSLLFSVSGVPVGFSASLDARTGRLELTPRRDFNGRIEVGFTATDSTGLAATELVGITFTPVDDPPIITDSFPAGREVTMPENSSTDFSVVVNDVDSLRLVYFWFLDGLPAGSGPTFTYSADYDSAGLHGLTAIVSDGELNISRTWNVTVTNVDRPPANVTITSPADGARFKPGQNVRFSADAVDPDGGALSFSWVDSDGKPVGTGRDLAVKGLASGKHIITLEVSDGNATVSATVSLTVSPPAGSKAPGFSAAAALLAAALAIFLATNLRRR